VKSVEEMAVAWSNNRHVECSRFVLFHRKNDTIIWDRKTGNLAVCGRLIRDICVHYREGEKADVDALMR